jgi:lipopolysaccharide export system protein LptA
MSRLKRIAGGFAVMLIAYWLYALTVVPLIEPSLSPAGGGNAASGPMPKTVDLAAIQVEQLKQLGVFQPDAWELKNPKILESNTAKLLFQEYENTPDGRVLIKPCTIVFADDGPPVVLEAPAGAVLEFDKPLDLKQMKAVHLSGGRLVGPVVLRSNWKQPGEQDDLFISTRDVRLTESEISTPHEVDFRWGPHFGRGRHMLIKLIGARDAERGAAGTRVSGVESFELREVSRLHLEADQSAMRRASPMTGAPPPSTTAVPVPVEITCRGPFRFDVPRRAASFNDHATVSMTNPDGTIDQLTAETLTMYFVPRKTEQSTASAATLDLTPERLEARGAPVQLASPGRKVLAHGQRIEYNLMTETITLDGGREVFLKQGANEIHAPSLRYQAAPHGRLGQAAAQGPGWFRGQLGADASQSIEASWNGQLRLYPQQQRHVIAFDGGATLGFPAVGKLLAKEIFFWLNETATPDGGGGRLQPEWMLARGEARLDSPNLVGKVEQMEIKFDAAPASAPLGGAAMSEPAAARGGVAPGAQPAAQIPQTETARFEVLGRSLRANVLFGAARPTLARLQLLGEPAAFQGQGFGLIGTNINLDAAANKMWIDGAGRMDLPLSGLAAAQHAMPSGGLSVAWRRAMVFDGRVAHFDQPLPQQLIQPGGVTAEAARLQTADGYIQFQLQTASMQIHLLDPVNFAQPDVQGRPRAEKIHCLGGVEIESRSFNLEQRQLSRDSLQAEDLAVNVQNGATDAGGPGRLFSVRCGPQSDAAVAQEQLYCLGVRFQKNISGSLPVATAGVPLRLTFSDQVRMSYSPTDDWNARPETDNPDLLGPHGIVARCDRLSVDEVPVALKKSRALAVEALGNARVENTEYTARAHRITYDQGKDLLVLEGDGLSHAELFQQPQAGAAVARFAAKKILYWPKTKTLSYGGAQSLQIGQGPLSGVKKQ